MLLYRVALLILLLHCFTIAYGEPKLVAVQKLLTTGDYPKARLSLDSLQEQFSENPEYQALLIIYLSDIGARHLAFDTFWKLYECGYEELSLNKKLTLLQALCFSYYEAGLMEGYFHCIGFMKSAIDESGKKGIQHRALYEAYMSRYYALNMESVLAYKAGSTALKSIPKFGSKEDSLLVVTFALNGTRNFEGEPPLFIDRIISAKSVLADLAENKSMRFGTKIRLMLMLGNIIQDAGYRIEHDTSHSNDIISSKLEYTSLAIRIYKEAATLASEKIASHNHIVSYAYSLIGLQYSYLNDLKSFNHYSKLALTTARYNIDSLQYISPIAYNVAVRYRARLAYQKAHISSQDSTFFASLDEHFKHNLEAFTRRQAIEYNAQNGWLIDGYSLNPCFDYIPFYLYFKGQNAASYDLARMRYGLFEYAGLKLHLINQIMGNRFALAVNQLEKSTTQKALKAEQAYFQSKELLPKSSSVIVYEEINHNLIKELNYFLDGKWLKSGKAIQRGLKEGEAYIELLELNTSVSGRYVWIVTRDHLDLLQINVKGLQTEEESVKILHGSMDDIDHFFSRMYRKIWRPIDQLLIKLNVQDVVFNSGFEFEHFPFEALIDDNGKRILEKYTLSYVHDISINDLKDLIQVETNTHFRILHTSYLNGRLPMMERLAQKLGLLYGDLLDPNLSKTALLEAMGNAGVLHIGAHGVNASDINTPVGRLTNRYLADSSYIQLHNDKLWMRDVEQVKLSLALTVLAACETGKGVISRGEGKIDFTRVFVQAGSAGVIGSFWPLDDGSTSIILSTFYDNLFNGQTPAVALHNAKLDFIQNTPDPIYRHPFYWAGLFFVGESKAITAKYPSNLWLTTLLFLLFLLALLKTIRATFQHLF